MNRITRTFETLRRVGKTGLVGYLTAGDPDMAASEALVREALENGVDILELGVPFSDPTADGPTIQAASQRALAAGTTLAKVLEMVPKIRADFDAPIVMFGYANPLFSYGYETVCAAAAEAGVDGMLVVDLPFEEAAELRVHMDRHGLSFIPLIAPTTPPERVRMILSQGQGFVYYIMVTGVTGARSELAAGVGEHVATIRQATDLPVAVGFGISSGDQARRVRAAADAVVVGSALVEAARRGALGALVRELRAGLDG
ncbi:MAG: tryptophan synthase subunit alpha [Kiritimatiellae bacterium]|nr:tryptophan synthase subunit alpha [Kiritimatiellia bacterium]